MTDELLVVRGLTKSFPGTTALRDLDLTLKTGRITCLAGHNGSGKSTLVKTLAGVYRQDSGSIDTPRHAHRGEALHIIHQDLGLVGDLTTVENLDLGKRRRIWSALGAPSRSQERVEARRLLGRFGVELDVTVPLRSLSPAQQTMVAIARALSGWTSEQQVLVLDEPTAALQDREADVVLDATRRIAERGAAVLFISHRLGEIERIADEVVVLRDGAVVATRERGEFDAHQLVDLIAGRELGQTSRVARPTQLGEPGEPGRFAVNGLSGTMLNDVHVEVGSGEVVGVSGVMGSGVDELLPSVFGAHPRFGGQVLVDGAEVDPDSIRAAIAAGVGFVPRDRHRHGAVLGLPARENLTLPALRGLRTPWRSVNARSERREARHWFGHAAVHPADPERTFATFSGGNQQKIVLARWMRTTPKVLLLEEPTQGVDVGAQGAVHELVRQVAASGSAVLVASTDTKELVTLCDRVLVMSGGRIVAELAGEQLTETTLVRLTLATTHATTYAGPASPAGHLDHADPNRGGTRSLQET